MDFKDRNQTRRRRLSRSFRCAWAGLTLVVRQEQNMKFHLLTAAVVITCGFVFSIPLFHWMILVLVIGGMFALEVMNTAVERVVDMITEEYDPGAEKAKDIAAAAVFVYSIAAAVIGILIFYQPAVKWLFL
ncbi:diacylglycerol kinase family protein [Salibacterium halotolerans]|uniref:Undecaprenol kinase n=1 Tax=Salibacterium halotolerans TaxID=1884432 RepID=A0A1I5NGI3_9BACI|nr:diacylglycerol kinase family protein [Salibacterium halotolerans]SFP20879.1 undecaprenol kinase [Salibacterium halotolerans]